MGHAFLDFTLDNEGFLWKGEYWGKEEYDDENKLCLYKLDNGNTKAIHAKLKQIKSAIDNCEDDNERKAFVTFFSELNNYFQIECFVADKFKSIDDSDDKSVTNTTDELANLNSIRKELNRIMKQEDIKILFEDNKELKALYTSGKGFAR